jgi:hypothetical protein
MVAGNLSLGVAVGTTKLAKLFARPARSGAVQGESDETAGIEGLVDFITMPAPRPE